MSGLAPGHPCSAPQCESPARLYPCGWRCDEHAPGPVLYPLAAAARDIRHTDPARPGPCRICHRPSWRADTAGAVHACCLAWQHVIAAGHPCPACQIAEFVLRRYEQNRRRETANEQRAGKGLPPLPMLPVLPPSPPPLPRTLPDGTLYVPDPAPVTRCTACGQPMAVITPGQRTHPLCATGQPAQPRREAA